ncbi:SUMF1/EgtB/PvdO family nonheme iron enzyme [bacterium]|nr:SUMF1/EgtB/PvdO family nonheme iron enzyme [bacterium]
MKKLIVFLCLFVLCFVSGFCEDIQLDLQMPGHTFVTGAPCFLDIDIMNLGQTYNGSKLLVILDVGIGEYWFYPTWVQYPPDVAWEDLSIPELAQINKGILPEFAWPDGTGQFFNASFITAIVASDGTLISNVDIYPFGWTSSPLIESIEPASGPPGKLLRITGKGFNLESEEIWVNIGSHQMPVISKGVNEDNSEYIVSLIPPIDPGAYTINISVGSMESNASILSVDPVAPTGYALGEVVNEMSVGMADFVNQFVLQIIPDAITAGAILPENQEVFNETIARANTFINAAFTEMANLPDEEKLLLESAMIQSGVFDVFMEMTKSYEKYRGPGDIASADLRIIMDITSACISVVDDVWMIVDIVGTIGGGPAGGGTAVIIHLGIKIIDNVLDGFIATELEEIHIAGHSSDMVNLYYNQDTPFTLMGTFQSQVPPLEATLDILIESLLATLGLGHYADAVEGWIIGALANLGVDIIDYLMGSNIFQVGPESTKTIPVAYGHFFSGPFSLSTLISMAAFSAAETPLKGLMYAAGNFDCQPGVFPGCNDCLEWNFSYENMTLTAIDESRSTTDLRLKWFVFEPLTNWSWLTRIEIPRTKDVRFTIHMSQSSNPTPTPPPATATPTSGPGTPTPTPPLAPTNFVYIPPGTFLMGSPLDELCRDSDETQHQITLTHGFYLQQTEVTQQQWVNVFGNNPSRNPGMNHPVEQVTWYDACIFSNRLSTAGDLTPCYYSDESYSTVFDGTPPVTSGTVFWHQSANGYRLPTESEWEYACRAGTTSAYNSGQTNTSCGYEDPNLNSLAWYWNNSDTGNGPETHPVGLKQPNNWELYDMHGNVWEWCWDRFGTYPTGSVTDPIGPTSGSYRVSRGGSSYNYANSCRSADR